MKNVCFHQLKFKFKIFFEIAVQFDIETSQNDEKRLFHRTSDSVSISIKTVKLNYK